jgi:hypothetical protein
MGSIFYLLLSLIDRKLLHFLHIAMLREAVLYVKEILSQPVVSGWNFNPVARTL